MTLTSFHRCASMRRAATSGASTTIVMREMPGLLGHADRQRLDVEAAAAEERRHAREHARLVLDVDDEYMWTSGRQ